MLVEIMDDENIINRGHLWLHLICRRSMMENFIDQINGLINICSNCIVIIFEDIENSKPMDEIKSNYELSSIYVNENENGMNPTIIILVNGQSLSMNFEENV
jgi:hypothetical protein